MNRVFILLGSNIHKEENLPTAISLLRQMCQVGAVSSVYETVPVGLRDQPNFWNTAVLLETPLSIDELREQVLHEIERRLNRRRTADKNAPRTIDLDIILFNEEVLENGRHHIPDPDLLKFPHVAVPVAELAPTMLHPETAEPLAAIASRLMAQAGTSPILWRVDG